MLKAIYDKDRKAKKFWHRLFFIFIEITLVNSYVTYCDLFKKIPLLQFKRRVTQGLLAKGKMKTKKRGRPQESSSILNVSSTPPLHKKGRFSVSNDIRLENRGAHWPEFVKKRGRYELCASRKVQSRPHSKCKMCKVYLCVNEKKNCFFEYHHE